MKSNLNFRVLLFAAMYILGLRCLDYSDLQAMDVACPDRDSCLRRTNQSFSMRNCECDHHCAYYNDCCINANGVSSRPRLKSTGPSCMPFNTESQSGAYVISKCPRNWQGLTEVKERCEVLSDLSDPFVASPVTVVRQGITYRNRFCSECNDANPDELQSWQIQVICESLSQNFTWDNLSYRSSDNVWGINLRNVFHACEMTFLVPPYLSNSIRECVANVVSTCPRTWRRPQIKRMCEAYTAITHRNHEVYRNPHCALCNGVGIYEMSCDVGIVSRKKQPMSFAMLVDINRNDGDVVGVSNRTRPTCRTGEKYDAAFKRCRGVICALPGTKMVNGKCVRA